MGEYDKTFECCRKKCMMQGGTSNRCDNYCSKFRDASEGKQVQVDDFSPSGLAQRIEVAEKGKDHQISLDYEIYKYRGIARLNKGNLDEALQDVNSALIANPYDTTLYNVRGLIYQKQGDYKDAIIDFSRAIKLRKPKFARSSFFAENDLFHSLNWLISLASSFTPFADAYYNRGYTYYLMKKYVEADKDMREAVALGYKVDAELLNELDKVLKQGQKR